MSKEEVRRELDILLCKFTEDEQNNIIEIHSTVGISAISSMFMARHKVDPRYSLYWLYKDILAQFNRIAAEHPDLEYWEIAEKVGEWISKNFKPIMSS